MSRLGGGTGRAFTRTLPRLAQLLDADPQNRGNLGCFAVTPSGLGAFKAADHRRRQPCQRPQLNLCQPASNPQVRRHCLIIGNLHERSYIQFEDLGDAGQPFDVGCAAATNPRANRGSRNVRQAGDVGLTHASLFNSRLEPFAAKASTDAPAQASAPLLHHPLDRSWHPPTSTSRNNDSKTGNKNRCYLCGVSDPHYLVSAPIVGGMAQPHKGDRKQIGAALNPLVKAELVWRAKHFGLHTSDYVAGIAALTFGRADLAGRLAQAAFGDIPPVPDDFGTDGGYITPRFPRPVYDLIRQRAGKRGVPMGYIVDELCAAHVDGPVAHSSEEQGDLLTSA